MQQLVSVDEAVRTLRADPRCADLVRDAYLGRDVQDSAVRFAASAEFAAVRGLLAGRLDNGVVLDLGAGTGIGSSAMLGSGASRVIALEPDPSDEVGRGAIVRLDVARQLVVLDSWGEQIGLASGSVDVVYARQVLHHAQDLGQLVRECARVLRPGGLLLACRDHVVDDDRQLHEFLAAHPVHRLAGGENAFHLEEYLQAIRTAGLAILRVIGPWDSVINAFPVVRSDEELRGLPQRLLKQRLGVFGGVAASFPFFDRVASNWLRRPRPGRLYTFLAMKDLYSA